MFAILTHESINSLGEHMRASRRDFLARSTQLGVLLGAGVPLLQACGDDDKGSSKKKTDPIADGLSPESGPLRIINYADYVNLEVIADFENEYGVKVEITTIDTDTEATTNTTRWRARRSATSSTAGSSSHSTRATSPTSAT
jgi:hypothetical protein